MNRDILVRYQEGSIAAANRSPSGQAVDRTKAGYALREGNMKRLITEQKLGPSDFAAEVERLKAEGKLPPLERVLSAVAEIREIYRPRILAARKTRRAK